MKPVALWIGAMCLFAATLSKAAPPARFGPLLPVLPVLVFGEDARESADDFARSRRLDPTALLRRHAASGVIQCGAARGAGQLTYADNIITTAAHVFFDERGARRADSAHCLFTVEAGAQQIATPIEMESILAGSADPYAQDAVHDWAVARLKRPLREAQPYPLGAPASGQSVRFAARGHVDWGEGRELALQECHLRETLNTGAEGVREVSFDCAAGLGASGGALLDPESAGLVGIFVGYRSRDPGARFAFAPDNYNFAVTVEGAFRRAILEEAGAGL